MGGKESGGPVTIGYHYFLSMQLAICQGPIDYIKDIRSYENTVIYGFTDNEARKLRPDNGINTPSVVVIQKPSLYGGVRKEGGVGTDTAKSSTVYFLWGGPKQPKLQRLEDLIDGKISSAPVASFSQVTVPEIPANDLAQALKDFQASKIASHGSTSTTTTAYVPAVVNLLTPEGTSQEDQDTANIEAIITKLQIKLAGAEAQIWYASDKARYDDALGVKALGAKLAEEGAEAQDWYAADKLTYTAGIKRVTEESAKAIAAEKAASTPVAVGDAAVKSFDILPAFRGVVSCVWDDLHYQTNSSRPKPWNFKVCRIPFRGIMQEVYTEVSGTTKVNADISVIVNKATNVFNSQDFSSGSTLATTSLGAYTLNGVRMLDVGYAPRTTNVGSFRVQGTWIFSGDLVRPHSAAKANVTYDNAKFYTYDQALNADGLSAYAWFDAGFSPHLCHSIRGMLSTTTLEYPYTLYPRAGDTYVDGQLVLTKVSNGSYNINGSAIVIQAFTGTNHDAYETAFTGTPGGYAWRGDACNLPEQAGHRNPAVIYDTTKFYDLAPTAPSTVAYWKLLDWDAALCTAVSGMYNAGDGVLYTGTPITLPGAATVVAEPILTSLEIEEANPAFVILEVLIHHRWGLNYHYDYIDIASFELAAGILFQEGMGISAIWENGSTVDDFLVMVLHTINAVLYVDPKSGKFVLKLIRKVDAATMKHANESNTIEMRNYARLATSELTNQVTVQWTDPIMGTAKSMTVHNTATREMQGANVAIIRQYPMVTSSVVAYGIAARDLAIMSQPIAQVELIVNREFASISIGDVIKWSWADLGIESMELRVSSVGYGLLEDGRITLKCSEDIFGADLSVFGTMATTEWANPAAESPKPPTAFAFMNLNRLDLFRLRSTQGNTTQFETVDEANGAVAVFAAKPVNSTSCQFDLMLKNYLPGISAETLGSPIDLVNNEGETSTKYSSIGVYDFIPYAKLAAAVTKEDTVFTLKNGIDLQDVQVKGFLNSLTYGSYVYCDGEIMEVVSLVEAGTGMAVKRGMINTIPKPHAADAELWFYSASLDKITIDKEWVAGQTLVGTPLTQTAGSVLKATAALQSESIVVNSDWANPYPPANIQAVVSNGDLTISWGHRDAELQSHFLVGQTELGYARSPGIYYSIRILRGDGTVLYDNPRYVGHLPLFSTNYIYHLETDDYEAVELFIYVNAVQGDRCSVWNSAAVNVNNPTTKVVTTYPVPLVYTPVYIGIAESLIVSVTSDTLTNTAQDWEVFEGSNVELNLSSNIQNLVNNERYFFSKYELDNWFDHYKIEVLSSHLVTGTPPQPGVLATHTTNQPKFTYSLMQNSLDHAVEGGQMNQRYFTLRVCVVDNAGNESASVTTTYANPAPLVTALDLHQGTGLNLGLPYFKATLSHNVSLDKVEVHGVKGDTKVDFIPTPATLLTYGTSLDFPLSLSSSGKWNFKIRAVDSFGEIGCNYSEVFNIDTATNIENIKAVFGTGTTNYRGLRGDFGATLPTGILQGDASLQFVKTGLSGYAYTGYPVFKYNGTAWVSSKLVDFTDIVLMQYTSGVNGVEADNTLWKLKTDFTGFDRL